MKIAIVGGCFTNQHNIPFNCLYHQNLKKMLEGYSENVEIITIRYERISKCLEKIIELQKVNDINLLIFHLRAEPIMRMSKLYYRYLNNDGKIKHALNLPYLKIFYPEKFDLLSQIRVNAQENIIKKESKVYHFLRETNYLLGSLIGNKKYALNVLKSTILQIRDVCFNGNVNFLLLGPVLRPFSKFEDKLSKEINNIFELLTKEKSIKYLSLIKNVTSNNIPMFFENGIHVSQAGHDEIANMIFKVIIEEKIL